MRRAFSASAAGHIALVAALVWLGRSPRVASSRHFDQNDAQKSSRFVWLTDPGPGGGGGGNRHEQPPRNASAIGRDAVIVPALR